MDNVYAAMPYEEFFKRLHDEKYLSKTPLGRLLNHNDPKINKYIIAGGAIRDTIIGIYPKDFDIFSPGSSLNNDFATLDFTKWTTLEFMHQRRKRGSYGSNNVLLTDYLFEYQLQYINPNFRYGDPHTILDNFDYTMNQFAIYNDKLYYNKNAIGHILRRIMVPVNLKKDDNKFAHYRITHFLDKGWKMSEELYSGVSGEPILDNMF